MLMTTERLNDNAAVTALLDAPRETDPDLRHFIMLTDPNCELKARDGLKDRGFDPYVPIEEYTGYRAVRSYAGISRRKYDATRPIFRGYLFLPLNLAWSFGALHGCHGLRQNGNPFLIVNERPASLSSDSIEKIRRIERALAKPGTPTSPFRLGDRVMVDGFDEAARIADLADSGRIMVLMQWLGAERMVETSVLKIAPAS